MLQSLLSTTFINLINKSQILHNQTSNTSIIVFIIQQKINNFTLFTVRPLNVQITTPQRPLIADKRAEFKCESYGARPSAVVTWWKGPRRLQHVNEDVSSLLNLTTSVVYFKPSYEDDGKVLACRADHSILPDSSLEDSRILNVHCK